MTLKEKPNMVLKDELTEDMKQALRLAGKDPAERLRLSTLRLLLSEIKNAEIAKHEALSDDEVLTIVQRQVKRRNESIEQYEKGGRQDLVDKETKEKRFLEAYLPEQLSEEEIRAIVVEAVEQTGAASPRDTGRVMGVVMPKVKGKADGKLVSQAVQEVLEERAGTA